MRFQIAVPVIKGAAGADPISTPSGVSIAHFGKVPSNVPGSDIPVQMIFVGFQGTAGDTITINLWAMDDATVIEAQNELTGITPAGLLGIRYYAISGSSVLTANTVYPIPIPTGWLYFQVTADSLTANTATIVASAAL